MSGATGGIWRSPLTWTMASLCLAVGLHVSGLPVWMLGIFVLFLAWRVLLSARGLRLPSRALRVTVTIAAVISVVGAYRTLNGMEAGMALLALMSALKLLEVRSARDHVVILVICYFLLLAAFLRSQSLALVPVHALSVWVTTTALLRATQDPETLTPRESLFFSGRALIQAVPFMLVLFLLFPRVPGAFWALPLDSRGRSGLSDEMNPGAISELTLSSDPVFRVRFHGATPPPAARYWRGPVLHTFDGNVWSRARSFAVGDGVKFSGPEFKYTLMLEPTGRNWIYALELASSGEEFARRRMSFDYQLLNVRPIDQPLTLELTSSPRYVAGETLSTTLRAMDTRLPPEPNPRTRQLAARMRASARSDQDYIDAVLRMFREQEFFYTLKPFSLDQHPVDEFLFNTRRGFCEHYASAFAVLMRAAGVPARVVTGYQGGVYNRVGDFWIVRQSDAHAWTEVWLEGRGWSRVDPTAAVAPERIERGSGEVLGDAAPLTDRLFRDYTWLGDLRNVWDAVNTAWREKILEFNQEAQLKFLKRLGLDNPDWRALAIALGVGLAGAIVILSLWMARGVRVRERDPVARAYRRFCGQMERGGITRFPHEGPLDFLRRVERFRPELAKEAQAITDIYVGLRYDGHANPDAASELCRRVRRFTAARKEAGSSKEMGQRKRSLHTG